MALLSLSFAAAFVIWSLVLVSSSGHLSCSLVIWSLVLVSHCLASCPGLSSPGLLFWPLVVRFLVLVSHRLVSRPGEACEPMEPPWWVWFLCVFVNDACELWVFSSERGLRSYEWWGSLWTRRVKRAVKFRAPTLRLDLELRKSLGMANPREIICYRLYVYICVSVYVRVKVSLWQSAQTDRQTAKTASKQSEPQRSPPSPSSKVECVSHCGEIMSRGVSRRRDDEWIAFEICS